MVSGINIIGQNKALQDHEIKRIVAFIVDAILVWIVSAIIVFIAFPLTWTLGGFGGFAFGFATVILGFLGVLYWTFFEGMMGATLGKKLMNLQVVGTTGPMDIVKALIRNITKIHGLLLFIDWIIGIATEGDPRQKFTDRFAGTTVVRTDQHAYVEEQFRQMATPPPHPAAPGWQAWGQPAQPAPATGAPPAQGAPAPPPGQGWPGQPQQPAGGGWPQHQWNEQGQLTQPRFCSNCGGPLVPRGDGKLTCSRCGAVV